MTDSGLGQMLRDAEVMQCDLMVSKLLIMHTLWQLRSGHKLVISLVVQCSNCDN